MLRQALGFPLLLCLMSLLLTGCHDARSHPMRIGMNVWPGYEPLILARHLGELRERDFRLVEFSDASEVVRAFRNRTLEAACVTLDEALYIAQDGLDPVITIVIDDSKGGDVLLARREIASLSELKGKRIAVEVSAVGAYMLTRSLQHAGLERSEITPVYVPHEKHIDAFTNGLADAVVTFEPVRTKLLRLGAVELFDSSQIPGEIVDVLVVHRDCLEADPGRVRALRDAWFAALAHLARAPEEAIPIMARREHLTEAEFKASLEGLHFPDEAENGALLGPEPRLLKTAEQLKTVMRGAGLLQKDVPLEPLFDLPHALKQPP